RSLNQLFGLIPGMANGLITTAMVAALLLVIPFNEGLSERVRSSQLVNGLSVYIERLETALHPVFGDAIAQTLNLLTVQPDSDERVTLPFTVPVSRPRPDLEMEMLRLVNTERVAAGLRPLAPDPELTEVARQHSSDMFARGYFAHDTPEGRDPFDRIRAGGVRFLTAGENLALARSVQIAHTGLMNSPGHRANILRPEFGRLGIGIMDGGMRGLMVTQNFRN
ncbi:MAG: CAP domain-containing protein, partial [Pyrinomonadaceae bacterium]